MTSVPDPELLPDRDLALHRRGQSARERGTQLRAAAPLRTFVSRVTGARTDERNWRIGADAEERVAKRPAGLGEWWRVLHAIPDGERGSDIDLLVIGPAGVFTVNTKHHPDATVWVGGDVVTVDGHHETYVRNSRFEASRTGKLLAARLDQQVPVRGVVAVVGAHQGFTIKAQPADGLAAVVASRALTGYLTALPTVFDRTVDRVHAAARHLATWQPKTVRWDDFD